MTDEVASDRLPSARAVEVRPANRINVAFGPFSKIDIQEPSKELAELASVVAELAAAVEGLAPGPHVENLRRQAQKLAVRLR